MTAEHVLQDCPKYADLKRKMWPTQTIVENKLYDGAEILKKTTAFIRESRIPN
jgi:hypothetical protein